MAVQTCSACGGKGRITIFDDMSDPGREVSCPPCGGTGGILVPDGLRPPDQ